MDVAGPKFRPVLMDMVGPKFQPVLIDVVGPKFRPVFMDMVGPLIPIVFRCYFTDILYKLTVNFRASNNLIDEFGRTLKE